MSPRRLIAATLLLLAGSLGLWARARPRLSDEAMILKMITDVKRAVEAKNVSGVLKYVSDDYNDGTYTKRDITRLVVSAFREPEPFRVFVEPPQLQIVGSRAKARVRAQFWIGSLDQAGGGQQLDPELDLIRSHHGWQVIRGTGWESAPDPGT